MRARIGTYRNRLEFKQIVSSLPIRLWVLTHQKQYYFKQLALLDPFKLLGTNGFKNVVIL